MWRNIAFSIPELNFQRVQFRRTTTLYIQIYVLFITYIGRELWVAFIKHLYTVSTGYRGNAENAIAPDRMAADIVSEASGRCHIL